MSTNTHARNSEVGYRVAAMLDNRASMDILVETLVVKFSNLRRFFTSPHVDPGNIFQFEGIIEIFQDSVERVLNEIGKNKVMYTSLNDIFSVYDLINEYGITKNLVACFQDMWPREILIEKTDENLEKARLTFKTVKEMLVNLSDEKSYNQLSWNWNLFVKQMSRYLDNGEGQLLQEEDVEMIDVYEMFGKRGINIGYLQDLWSRESADQIADDISV